MQSNHTSINKTILILIHGVGAPGVGEIKTQVEENISANSNDIDTIEINWNQIVEQSTELGFIKYESIIRLLKALTYASRATESNIPLDQFNKFLSFSLNKILNIIEILQFFVLITILSVPVLILRNLLAKTSLLNNFNYIDEVFIRLYLLIGLLSFMFLTASFILASICRNISYMHINIRRLMLLLIKPLVLFYIPFFIGFPKEFSKSLISYALPMYGVITPLIFLISIAISKFSELSLFNGISEIFPFLSLLGFTIGFATISYLLNFFLLKMFGPILKIFLDIFRYVSEEEYRNNILRTCDEILGECFQRKNANIIIVSHSLGTVIMTDYLLNYNNRQVLNQLTFITMGSPLKRFFFRFFPNLCFPSSAESTFNILCKQYQSFRWINIYRPFDQVGAKINLPNTAYTSEINSKQFKGYFGSHINYFSDPLIRDILIDALNKIKFHRNNNYINLGWQHKVSYKVFNQLHLKIFNPFVKYTSIFILITLSIATPIQQLLNADHLNQTVADKAQLALKEGMQTKGKIITWITSERIMGDHMSFTIYHYNYIVSYKTSSKVRVDKEMLGENHQLFEDADLYKYTAKRCDKIEAIPPKRIMNQKIISAVCTFESLPILYLKNDESFFIVPKFPYKKKDKDTLSSLTNIISVIFQIPVYALFFGIILVVNIITINLYVTNNKTPLEFIEAVYNRILPY